MSQFYMTKYGVPFVYTPDDAALVYCRGFSVGTTGNIVLNGLPTGGTNVTLPVTAGVIYPIALDQGRILATGHTAGTVFIYK